ncbi:MAG: E2/UBC family protein [Actinomycetota bacterium]
MSTERVQAEIELLKRRHPDLECRDDGWCRLARYALPDGWSESEVELAFRVPENIPGEQPYAFWTKPTLTLEDGRTPNNTSGPVDTDLGPGWQQWSWQLEDWRPGPTPAEGSNVVDHFRSIAYRFRELD